jgi:hypothetical protein
VPYGLFLLDPASPSDLMFLATLKPVREGNIQGKAEAIYVLQVSDDELRLLVMFDGLSNGGAREYRVPRR